MASTSTMSLVTPLNQTHSSTFFNPLPLKPSKAMAAPRGRTQRLQVRASKLKFDKAVTGLSAAALTASMVIPEVAEAASPGISPSLKNFLLSFASGGVVLTVIIGAV
ncbi:hypothetical protein EUTSA_v10002862mg [Eutrema salsugineum]|uniref:Uncharacterized protein n=1 Tax=Eutrema salsugineum TaxID=72664 RepID=V4L3M0_EUTSA|nr:uncharacterized protein LOC18013577 [Eutrema salsugineum]ESQ36887.1 hypothetical protein EUTSA_v10002862mg [Eutrema salsugineum]